MIMSKQRYRVRNWRDYNKALVQRGSLTLWISEAMIKTWRHSKKTEKRGRQPYYSAIAILCGLTLRQVYGLPLRATEGLLESLLRLLKFKVEVPDYTTLCRRGKQLKIPLGMKSAETARHVLVDSTGVQVLGEWEWKQKVHGRRKRQVWRKLHIAMDADKQRILSAQVSESQRLDGNYLPELIKAIPGRIKQITGDGAYDKKCCYQTAYERGAKGIFPPQKDAIVQRNKIKKDPALLARDEVINFIGKGSHRKLKLKWWKKKNHYHQRSLIETLMWRMKSIFGDEIRSRTMENQRTDLLIRCYALNRMTELGLPRSVTV
jgi:IS5 family transposase